MGSINLHSQATEFDEMQELLWGRTDRLRLDLVDEAVGNADVAVIQQLANDQLVELLAVLQAHFGSVHLEDGEDNFPVSCKRKRVTDESRDTGKSQKQPRNRVRFAAHQSQLYHLHYLCPATSLPNQVLQLLNKLVMVKQDSVCRAFLLCWTTHLWFLFSCYPRISIPSVNKTLTGVCNR